MLGTPRTGSEDDEHKFLFFSVLQRVALDRSVPRPATGPRAISSRSYAYSA